MGKLGLHRGKSVRGANYAERGLQRGTKLVLVWGGGGGKGPWEKTNGQNRASRESSLSVRDERLQLFL